MSLLQRLNHWWSERRWSQARKHAAQWKRDALKHLKALQRDSKRLEKLKVEFDKDVSRSIKRIEELSKRFDQALDNANDKMQEAQRTISQYDHTEEMLNNELQVYRDVVVPQLTLAAEIGRQQMQAEIALQVQRQVVYSGADKMKE